MKRTVKIMAAFLTLSMAFSLCSCGKSIKKIDEDDFADALEDELDWEEDEDFRIHEEYEVYAVNFEDADDPYYYDTDTFIQGAEDDDEGILLFIQYNLFEDEDDAEEFFLDYYDEYVGNDSSRPHAHSGNSGYFIDTSSDTRFSAYYYAEDMVIYVSSFRDGADTMRDFVRSLGYPVK